MDETTKAQLSAVARELAEGVLTGGGHAYPFSAMLWELRSALDQFDPEASPGLAADAEAGRLRDAAQQFVARADELLQVTSMAETVDWRFSGQQLQATLAVLQQGPALVDQMAGLLVRHDDESPLLVEIGPLHRYAAAFRQAIEAAANRVDTIVSASDGSS